jgi:hypothetical protein
MRGIAKAALALTAATGIGVALVAAAGAASANTAPSANCQVTSFQYSANGGAWKTATVATKTNWPQSGLFGRGDTVAVSITVPSTCTSGQQFTLAAYRATSSTSKNASYQVLDNYQSVTFTAGQTGTLTATVPGTPAGNSADCSTLHDNSNGGGANQSPGPYNANCDGSASQNGKSTNNNSSKPCAGCVGNADNKNPPGQYPNGNDPNAGYECDSNQGVGQSNPAHTGCGYYQLDLAYGPVLQTVGNGSFYSPGLIAATHG